MATKRQKWKGQDTTAPFAPVQKRGTYKEKERCSVSKGGAANGRMAREAQIHEDAFTTHTRTLTVSCTFAVFCTDSAVHMFIFATDAYLKRLKRSPYSLSPPPLPFAAVNLVRRSIFPVVTVLLVVLCC